MESTARTTAPAKGRNPCKFSGVSGTPGGIRTPNLLIRSQMLYPLSYGRKRLWCLAILAGVPRGPHGGHGEKPIRVQRWKRPSPPFTTLMVAY